MSPKESIERRILRVLHQNIRAVPVGTIAREAGAAIPLTEQALGCMETVGLVRRAVPPEVEDAGILAYLPCQKQSAQVAGEEREPRMQVPPPRKSRGRKLRVAVDVDGIVADFMTPACQVVQEVTGRPFGPSDWTAWDVVESAKLTKEESDECFRRFHQPGFCRNLTPYADAQAGIARLREVADVAFLTAPMGLSPYWAFEREQWLREHFNAKGRIISTDAKDWCGADALVEDKEANVHPFLETNPGSIGILWHKLYNPSPSPRLHVVHSWEDVLSVIEKTYIL